MKYLLIILLFASCCKHRTLTVFLRNGSGLDARSTQVCVDSVTETTRTSAVIWIDGHKTIICAEEIMVANGY